MSRYNLRSRKHLLTETQKIYDQDIIEPARKKRKTTKLNYNNNTCYTIKKLLNSDKYLMSYTNYNNTEMSIINENQLNIFVKEDNLHLISDINYLFEPVIQIKNNKHKYMCK